MSLSRSHVGALLLALALAPWCAAQVQVTFPLQGFYRPGNDMPVRVQSSAATSTPVVLRAEGAVPASVTPGPDGKLDAVVPWLAATALSQPRWDIPGVSAGTIDAPLTPLQDDQILVGVVGPDPGAAASAAADLFPGRQVIPIPLTGTPPIPGHPAAWETLDAIVCDTPDQAYLDEFLAVGISVIVRSDARPAGDLPWRGGPGRWTVRVSPAGPRGAIEPGAYAPTSAWRPGWPLPLRRRAGLMALAFCLLALGATLWRPVRRAAAAAVVTSLVAALAFAWWGGRQPMLWRATTAVSVTQASGTQTDAWTYLRSLRGRDVSIEWRYAAKPTFASARHLRDTDLVLSVASSGVPTQYAWRASPGNTLAFVNRSFHPAAVGAGLQPGGRPPSPASELLDLYLLPGDVILSDNDDSAGPDDADWFVAWRSIRLRRP
jgi:hypothetical protein